MKYLTSVLVIILVLALVTFGLQNTGPAGVQFLTLHTDVVPLFVIIFVSALLGMAVVGLLSVAGRIQRGLETRRMRQQIADLEQQVADLKALVPPPVMKPLPGERLP
ncbi:MAG: LapA family protein [Herpetosiphonaceae bacterium]|nr:LapA family protein [Herpetosiphonaceae bacterium]